MAPRVFFSFHYARDIWRVNQVRNSWVTHGGTTQKFLDASLWEETKRRGPAAVQALIDSGLQKSDATAVLIGNETADRDWVRYEIEQSWARDNRIIGIRVNRLRDQTGGATHRGRIRSLASDATATRR